MQPACQLGTLIHPVQAISLLEESAVPPLLREQEGTDPVGKVTPAGQLGGHGDLVGKD